MEAERTKGVRTQNSIEKGEQKVKRRTIAFVFLMAFATLLFQTVCAAQKVRAFRDFYWGDGLMPLILEHNLMKISPGPSDVGMSLWVKKDENLQLGGELLKSISYGFFQNQLCIIIIRHYDAEYLARVARERFGAPVESKAYPLDERYVDGDTMCHVYDDLGEGVMMLYSCSLFERYLEWKDQAAKDAARDF